MKRQRFAIRFASAIAGLVALTVPLRADQKPTPNQLAIHAVSVDTVASEITISGVHFCASPVVTLAGAVIPAVGSASLIVAGLPGSAGSGDILLTVDCKRGNNGFDAWELTLGAAGPTGATGPAGATGATGATGPPGPSGVLAFYVVNGAMRTVAASGTDTSSVSCTAGDAAMSWSSEGYGLVAGPGVSGFLNVVPLVTASVPTGFTFTFVCATNPTCTVTFRIICADLTP